MKKLNEFLLPALAKRGLKKTVQSAEVCFFAQEWGKGRFTAISFSRGILKVSVTSSSAAQSLQMDEEKLVDFLNNKIGPNTVKSVRIMNVS